MSVSNELINVFVATNELADKINEVMDGITAGVPIEQLVANTEMLPIPRKEFDELFQAIHRLNVEVLSHKDAAGGLH